MVAVGVNKAAEQYMILDEQTTEDIAAGKYHDQRRGSFGTSPAAAPAAAPRPPEAAAAEPPRRPRPNVRPAQRPARKPWSVKQQRLALLYNEQGLRPDEIAAKLGLSTYLVTQIILTGRNRGKL